MSKKQVQEKFVKTFLDFIILSVLTDKPTHGYEIIAIVHKEFGILLSPGTVYPLLHSLVEYKLVSTSRNGSRIVYEVSEKGRQKFESSLDSLDLVVKNMLNFVKERNKEVVLGV